MYKGVKDEDADEIRELLDQLNETDGEEGRGRRRGRRRRIWRDRERVLRGLDDGELKAWLQERASAGDSMEQ